MLFAGVGYIILLALSSLKKMAAFSRATARIGTFKLSIIIQIVPRAETTDGCARSEGALSVGACDDLHTRSVHIIQASSKPHLVPDHCPFYR